jgi:hypothetical protein
MDATSSRLTNAEIDRKIGHLGREERRLTSEIVALVREAERRRLWAELGFASSFDWLTRGHGYSEGSAHRRISAARLVAGVPELEAKIASGEATISTLALVQAAIRREESRTGARIDAAAKREIAAQVEGKARPEAERILAAVLPGSRPALESLRPVAADQYRLSVDLSAEGNALLLRARELLSQAMPGASLGEVVTRLASEFVERKDPLKKAQKASATAPRPAPKGGSAPTTDAGSERRPKLAREPNAQELAHNPRPEKPAHEPRASRAAPNPAAGKRGAKGQVSASDRRLIFQRAGHACEWVNAATKLRCGSRFFLEIDQKA